MPELFQNGTMTIVAHVDDDLLFMNPDIANAIAEGQAATTIYVTAGDAGGADWYWQGRETGAKAAYAMMADAEDWVDETVTIAQAGSSFELTSSYLESAPQVRLYFLRIPDGAGAIADPADYQSLARLEDGTRQNVETVDHAASYTRADLVNVLSGLMEAHDPQAFRLQVTEGEYATGEHTDHLHATEFALEAMEAYSGTGYQVTHYVNYQSNQLAPNLSDTDAAFSLDVMAAYAAHDPGATDENGVLLPVYVDWSMRQHIAESYIATPDTDDPSAPEAPPVDDPAAPGDDDGGSDGGDANQALYSLGDHQDNFYFTIDPHSGEIGTKDWFSPSLQDAWDANADYIYEVTRITTPLDGSAPSSELMLFDTSAEGELTLLDGSDDPITDDGSDPVADDPVAGDPVAGEDDPVIPGDDPIGDTPALASYSLGDHQDNFYFTIDPHSGEIGTKDWFSPSLQDAWDENADYTYEVTRITTPLDGSAPSSELMLFDTSAEGELTLLTGSDPAEDGTVDDPVDPTVPEDADPITGSALSFTLSGPDAFLFEIAADTGIITPKDWFIPDYDDAWDQNEDHVYDLTRTGLDDTGTVASREFISYEVTPDSALVMVATVDDILFALSDPGADLAAEAGFADAALAGDDLLDAAFL